MIVPGPADSPGDFALLHLDPGCDTGSRSRVHMAYIKKITVFLSDIHGGIGIGQGLAPGNILHDQIFQDILLDWIPYPLLLQAI